MTRFGAIATVVVGVLASPMPFGAQQPNFSGAWTLAPRSSKSYTVSGSAFNCGLQCRIVHKDSRLTIDQAHLDSVDGPAAPAVTLQLDGQSQAVTDSVNIGNTIDTVSKWEEGKLLIASAIRGRLLTNQTLTLEQNALVVTLSSAFNPSRTITLRYTKK